jgi:hypothetical protein
MSMPAHGETKRGRALSGTPFASHRADRDALTVLSVLAGAHEI